jgi:hypothetical protein
MVLVLNVWFCAIGPCAVAASLVVLASRAAVGCVRRVWLDKPACRRIAAGCCRCVARGLSPMAARGPDLPGAHARREVVPPLFGARITPPHSWAACVARADPGHELRRSLTGGALRKAYRRLRGTRVLSLCPRGHRVTSNADVESPGAPRGACKAWVTNCAPLPDSGPQPPRLTASVDPRRAREANHARACTRHH